MLGICPSHVRRLDASDSDDHEPIDKFAFEIVLASSLHDGDLVLCTEGDVVPMDGLVIDGRATIDDAPRRSVQPSRQVITGAGLRIRQGTRLRSGYVVVRVTDWEDGRTSRRQDKRTG